MESIFKDKIVYWKRTTLSKTHSMVLETSDHASQIYSISSMRYIVCTNTKAVDIIYLDFQKAFDGVPHKRLLSKVKAHGITENLSKWIEDWLSECKQRVVINRKNAGVDRS